MKVTNEPTGPSFRPYRFIIHVDNELEHNAIKKTLERGINATPVNERDHVDIVQYIYTHLVKCG